MKLPFVIFFARLVFAVFTFHMSLTFQAGGSTLHVWNQSPNPAPPFLNWETAAHSIQEAVNAANAGDTVLVTNGVYASGGRAVLGTVTNRVAIEKPIVVRSVSGPALTIIEGAAAPGGGTGDGAVRCVYLAANAVLSGFTLRNGHTRTNGDLFYEQSGGGLWCEPSGLVMNCIVQDCSARFWGGGMYQGVARKSEFTGNSVAFDGGALFYGAADSCTFGGNFAGEAGGGAYECELRNCSFSGNSSGSHGGGVFGGTLHNGTLMGNSAVYGGGAVGGEFYNCLFIGNSATTRGGGTAESTLYNCTLTGNSATIEAGGTYGGTLFNCIVFYNSASYGPNHGQAAIHYSCTTPLPFYGAGNIINEPVFADPAADDYRLRAGSPGIDAGTNLTALLTSDLDGNARPLDGDGDSVATFDMGAYEFRLEENHSGSHKGGVFHFVVKKKMATTGMLADARGYVVSQQNQLNNAGNQSLSISMSGLEPGTPYQLWARRGDDTYPILITDFISSTSGFASLQYRRNRLNHRPGLRRGGNSLPEFLGPLRNLRELFIADSNLETVLVADLTSPDQLLLRFKAGLSNDGVDANASGSVNIAGSMRKAEIQLFARRLDPGATYHPTINGDATAPLFADPKGKLRFTTRLESPVDLLDVRTVGIRNTSNQDVLSIRLPY